MRQPEGTIEQRTAAYRLAREHFEYKAKMYALRVEQFSLMEKWDCLMTEWAGVDSHQRSDEYHESRKSLDNQMAMLESEIFFLKEKALELRIISEKSGLSPSFLNSKVCGMGKKKVT